MVSHAFEREGVAAIPEVAAEVLGNPAIDIGVVHNVGRHMLTAFGGDVQGQLWHLDPDMSEAIRVTNHLVRAWSAIGNGYEGHELDNNGRMVLQHIQHHQPTVHFDTGPIENVTAQGMAPLAGPLTISHIATGRGIFHAERVVDNLRHPDTGFMDASRYNQLLEAHAGRPAESLRTSVEHEAGDMLFIANHPSLTLHATEDRRAIFRNMTEDLALRMPGARYAQILTYTMHAPLVPSHRSPA